jgi:glycosyltransferase involved in cell wall biosynthesis
MPQKITMVIPTRNRAHTLRLVLDSWYQQKSVDEIILVNDAGSDSTDQTVAEISVRYPNTKTTLVRNPTRLGAAASRNRGALLAKNSYVLFCDDDEILETDYAEICLNKLLTFKAGAVSGRRVYMRNGETAKEALNRFGDGFRSGPVFLKLICEHVGGARHKGDIEIPFTNAIIVTPTEFVRKYGFDSFYSKGNGYREESDYQMNLFVNGERIILTSLVHSIHLSPNQCSLGGQSASRWERVKWSIFYTRYFYKKYWKLYASRMGIRTPQSCALGIFVIFSLYREYLRPSLHRIAMFVPRLKASVRLG